MRNKTDHWLWRVRLAPFLLLPVAGLLGSSPSYAADDGLTAIEVEKLGPVDDDRTFGRSVATDGDTLVVGAQASVYVYDRGPDEDWVYSTQLTEVGPFWDDEDAMFVDVDGNVILVGSRSRVLVFYRGEDGSWVPDGDLIGGQDAAVAADTVGIATQAEPGSEYGPLYLGFGSVYRRLAAGSWVLETELPLYGEVDIQESLCGHGTDSVHVDVDLDRIALGARYYWEDGLCGIEGYVEYQGATAAVFTRVNDSWVLESQLGDWPNSQVGGPFVLDGNYLIADGLAGIQGADVRVFFLERNPDGQWVIVDESYGGGDDVEIAGNRSRHVRGNSASDAFDGYGRAWLWSLETDGPWRVNDTFSASDGDDSPYKDSRGFGTSVAMAGEEVIVGSPSAWRTGGESRLTGFVYVFNVIPGTDTVVRMEVRPGQPMKAVGTRYGMIPVAMLSTAHPEWSPYDALRIDPARVWLGRGQAAVPVSSRNVRVKDADGDGLMDLVIRFPARDAGILCGDTGVPLYGYTYAGDLITSRADIQTVLCR